MLAALAITWPARAQDPAPPRKVRGPPRLEYSAPPGCPDEATFKHEVAFVTDDNTGKDPFDTNAPDVVRVTFTKIRGGYRGRVQYTPAKGDPWSAEDTTGTLCLLIFRAVATTASLRIQDPPPKDSPAPEPTEPAPAEPTPAPPDPIASKRPEAFTPPPIPQLQFNPPTLPRQPPSPPPPPMDLTIVLSTTVLATAGFTADAGPAVQLGADIRGDWLSLGLELRGVLPGKVYARDVWDPTKESSERSFDVSQLTALLVPCVRFATYFAGCGVVQGGTLILQTPAEMRLQGFVGFGPRFAIEVPFADRFAAFAFGEALFAPSLRAYVLDLPGPNGEPAPNVVWRRSVVSGFFGAGLSVKFQ